MYHIVQSGMDKKMEMRMNRTWACIWVPVICTPGLHTSSSLFDNVTNDFMVYLGLCIETRRVESR